MKRRVVITGLGAITPIGNTVEEFWNGIKNGTVGIGPITKFDTTEYKVKIAAEVKDFVAKERMDFKASKRMETFSQYAVAAAKEACADAGFEIEKEDPYRCGVIIGSGIGSLQQIEKQYTTILEKGPGRVAPLMVPMMISNMAAGNVSIQLGLKRKVHKCRYSMCNGNQLYRGCASCNSVRRCGRNVCRWYGKLYLSDGDCRIYRTYRTYYQRRSTACINSI